MNCINEHIQRLSSYKPPLEARDPEAHLLLDFNERTIPVAAHIKEAIINFLSKERLMVYPTYGNLTDSIAFYAQVKPSQILCTNGSDQGIELVVRGTTVPGDEVIIPNPSFAMYFQSAQVQNLSIMEIPYTDDFQFPILSIKNTFSERSKLIVIPTPNNPTGTLVSVEEILEIARQYPRTAIMVDECYFEYSKTTVKDYVEELNNLFVLRTFSKTWGLSSLRIGYIISSEENINNLLKIRGPYDINQLAAIAVQAALENPEYVMSYVREVLEESKPLMENFFEEQNIRFWPSAANFLLWYPPKYEKVYQHLVVNNILTRPRKDAKGTPCIRMTLGTKKQTEQVMNLLKEVVL